jgi:N-acetylglucosamine-6-phosphate deacetylase
MATMIVPGEKVGY